MKDLGQAKKVLGMKIERDRDRDKVRLTKKWYLQKVPQKFNINGDIKSVNTPLTPHFKYRATMSPTTIEERGYMSRLSYVNAMGRCMLQCVQDPICHKLLAWLVGICTISEGVIGGGEVDSISTSKVL